MKPSGLLQSYCAGAAGHVVTLVASIERRGANAETRRVVLAACESLELSKHKPQATVATARGLIGMTGASEPTSGIANLDAPTATWAGDLSIQHERHTTHCSFADAFHCPGTRVAAQLRGDLLLACVPQNQGADCDRFLRTEERRCVLVDFKRSTCHDLTSFDDVRFLANAGSKSPRRSARRCAAHRASCGTWITSAA